jgi:N-acetylmuramoyl-L-alanine amidase
VSAQDRGREHTPTSSADDPGPPGKLYTVQPGDCIESIAFEQGLCWETVWNAPENADLRQLRSSPSILFPGDEVYVPPKRGKSVVRPTEQRHRFVRRSVPSSLHIIVKNEHGPRAREPYVLEVDGEQLQGTTGDAGEIRRNIPPNARRCRVRVGAEPDAVEYDLPLGLLDPLSELTGVQQRLGNLGYPCGQADGTLSSATIAAITLFQQSVGLPPTGEVNQATRDALQREHGS